MARILCVSPFEYGQASEDLKLAQAAASSGGGGKKSKLAAAATPVDRPMFVEVSVHVAAKCAWKCGEYMYMYMYMSCRCDMLTGLDWSIY